MLTLGEVAQAAAASQTWDAVHPQSWQAVADAVVVEYEARRWKSIESAPKEASMGSTPEELRALYWRRIAHAINHATPEQCAAAMTKCTPEGEEAGRRFEDAEEAKQLREGK